MILVAGGTGTVGRHVVAQLLERGEPVRVLTRDPARAVDLAAEAVAGDLTRPDSLAAALAGVDAVFVLTGNAGDQVAEETNLIHAAAAAGARMVKLSAAGASEDAPIRLGRQHAQLERAVRDAGVPWTILRPYSFMQNLLFQAESIRTDGKFYGSYGEGRVALVDARDIAAVAVAALTEEGHDGEVYDVTGPRAITHADAAAALAAALGRPVEYVDVPGGTAREGMLASGMPAWLADDLVVLSEGMGNGWQEATTDVVARVGKREPTTIEDFARDHADALR